MRLGGHSTCPKLDITSQWQAQDRNSSLRPEPGLSTALDQILESHGCWKKRTQYAVGLVCGGSGGVRKGSVVEKCSHLLGEEGYIGEDETVVESCLDWGTGSEKVQVNERRAPGFWMEARCQQGLRGRRLYFVCRYPSSCLEGRHGHLLSWPIVMCFARNVMIQWCKKWMIKDGSFYFR